MRQRRAVADADDWREGHAVSAGPANVGVQEVAEFFLRVGRPHGGAQRGEALLRHADRATDRGYFRLVLDRAQSLDKTGLADQRCRRTKPFEPLELFQRDPGGFDADLAQAEIRHHFADSLIGVLVVAADVRLEARALVLDLSPVPVITDENAAFGRDETKAAVAGKAGQVGDVAKLGDDQGVEGRFPDGPGEVVTAAVEWGHAVTIGGDVWIRLSPAGRGGHLAD